MSDYVSLPSSSEVAKQLMDRQYKLKKILFAGGCLSTAGKHGRFVIELYGDVYSNFDFGALIEAAYENIKDNDDGRSNERQFLE